jgi:hypothetical protein
LSLSLVTVSVVGAASVSATVVVSVAHYITYSRVDPPPPSHILPLQANLL